MESNHSQIVSLIWNIADDVLRDIFLRGQYRDEYESHRQQSGTAKGKPYSPYVEGDKMMAAEP